MKKGVLWVSFLLYTALGIIIITIVLNAGIPLINKIRDRNIVTQTKTLMQSIDENIKVVSNEGPGSKRFLSPLTIDSGDLVIDSNNDTISWSLETKNKMAEPEIIFDEGALKFYLNETFVKDSYIVNLELSYKNITDINLVSSLQSPFKGTYSMSIEHTGNYTTTNLPIISIIMR